MKNRILNALPVLCLTSLVPAAAWAHYPWLTPADFAPEAGQALEFSIGWGHAYPGTDAVDAERIASAQMFSSSGDALDIGLGAGQRFTTPPLPAPGPWLLAARLEPYYYSRTPGGGQRASRADFPDALSCTYSSNAVKALLGTGDTLDRPLEHALEIIPLKGGASTGAPLPVRVLLHARPWQGTIHAVYAGYEGAENEYPVTVTTDTDGTAHVPLDRAGNWMLKVSASEPYPNPAICDRVHYNATLTLLVR